MDENPGLGARFMNWVRENHASQPSLVGQGEAMIREAAKDVRNTMNEVFFGQPEHAPEMGTPQNPTPQNVTEDLGNFQGYAQMLDSLPDRESESKGRSR